MKRHLSDILVQDSVVGDAGRNVRRRWTLRGQEFNGLPALPPVTNQAGFGGKCSYFSCITAFQSHLRLRGLDVNLSFKDLDTKVEKKIAENPEFRKITLVERLFRIMRDVGVNTMDSNDSYFITDFVKFDPQNHGHVNEAIKSYLRKGPMIGVFRLDPAEYNAYGRKKAGIYTVTAGKNTTMEKIRRMPTHAVCITGYGVDTSAPFFEIQNSHGEKWHCHGFGELFALDLIELYGFVL